YEIFPNTRFTSRDSTAIDTSRMVTGTEAGNLERYQFRPECQDILVERGNYLIRPDSQHIDPIIPFFLIMPLTIAGSATTSNSPLSVRTLAQKNGCPVTGFVS